MQVWITGARGFIGRHAARGLASAGHFVAGLGYGALTEGACTAWGLGVWCNGEVNSANLDAMAKRCGPPDAVLHLAGGSSVGLSFDQPAEDFRRSVQATIELADWLRLRAPQARVVLASSAAVYGAGHDGPIAESAHCRPFSPYGYHKRMSELVLESYAQGFGMPVAIVRLFSVFGQGLRKQLLWDACGRLARAEDVLALGGQGDEQRDWLHVEDAARLLAMAIDHASPQATVVNGGSGRPLSVHEVARLLCASWAAATGRPMTPVSFSGRGRPGDPKSLVADAALARAWGFEPRHRLEEALESYVEWYRRDQCLKSEPL